MFQYYWAITTAISAIGHGWPHTTLILTKIPHMTHLPTPEIADTLLFPASAHILIHTTTILYGHDCRHDVAFQYGLLRPAAPEDRQFIFIMMLLI
jgi:hypothetical protein